MTEIAAQVPALFEALSGMKMSDLMSNVKQMTTRSDGDGKPIVDGNATK
jgi:flotillin